MTFGLEAKFFDFSTLQVTPELPGQPEQKCLKEEVDFFFQSEFFFREIAFNYKNFVQRIAEQDLDIKNAILQQTKELGFAITCQHSYKTQYAKI